MLERAEVRVIDHDDTVLIEVEGCLTFINAGNFGESLVEATTSASEVVVDLKGAEFIDTQIVQDLGAAAVRLLQRNKRLRVVLDEKAYPYKVLEMTGFQAIMDIEVK